jgi:hypothetical protein
VDLLLIAVVGVLLARLHAGAGPGRRDPDLWRAFEAVMTGAEVVALPRRPGATLTTVGGMAVGDVGWAAATAVEVDDRGRRWLAAAAVVHPAWAPGRAQVRRDAAGWWVEQRDLVLDAPARPAGAGVVRVPVAGRFG